MSSAPSADGQAPPPLRVNKRELARILGVSMPTVTAYLDRFADFPVLEPGTNGREYQFDPVAVRAYLDAREAEDEAEEGTRQAAIAQLGLPIEDTDPAATGLLNAKDRLAYVRALAAEDDLRTARGFLVSVPAQRQALTTAVARWNRSLHAALRQAARDFNLPDAVARALADRIAETQRQFVRDLNAEVPADLVGNN